MLDQPLLFTGCSSIENTFSKLVPKKINFRKFFSLKILTLYLYSTLHQNDQNDQNRQKNFLSHQ